MDIIWVALAAAFGGILAGLLGWADAHEAFDARKFVKTFVVAIISGAIFALGYSLEGKAQPRDFLLALASGAGIDALSNRGIGAIGALLAQPKRPGPPNG